MRQFYDVTQTIKDSLIEDDNVNTVRMGTTVDYDLEQQNIYPLSHIAPGSVTLNGSTMTMTFSIFCLDLVDESTDDLRDVADTFHGIDNMQDVMNTQLSVVNRLVSRMQRGDLHRSRYQTETASLTPIQDRLPNLAAGWQLDLEVTVPNTEICVE